MSEQNGTAVTDAQVRDALKDVYDPEIPVSIVDLGLVYDVKIIDGWVGVKMTLTSPGCGMASMIANNARERLKKIPGVGDADVRIVWQPQWTPAMMTPEARKKLGWMG
ncbi:MAG TPA: metal-sulfur cluster assembly factor [Bacteroidota bacterium]|nr:metal-sulfur cluster assembly factor [Bacteroidota bacterium]